MSTYRIIVAGLAGVALVTACDGRVSGGDDTPTPARSVSSLAITGHSEMLTYEGQSVQLVARASWSDGGTSDATEQATWTSSAPDVASVTATGLVTARTSGSAAVTAVYQGVSARAAITIDLSQDSGWVFLGAVFANGVNDPFVTRILVDPRDDRLLYQATSNGLFVSRDRGATWTTIHTTGGIGLLDMDPRQPDRVLSAVSIGTGAVLRLSLDRGLSWRTLPYPGAFTDAIAFGRTASRTIYVAGTGAGQLFRSSDDGSTWATSVVPLPAYAGNLWRPWALAEDPTDGTLYLAGEYGDHPQPYKPPVLRSRDHGDTWQDITGIIPWHCTSIVVDPRTSAVYANTEGDGLYRSTDHGETWTRHGTSSYTSQLLLDPNVPKRLFVGNVYHQSRQGGVYLSNDGGATFTSFGLQQTGTTGCHGLATSGDSRLLFASCYGSGIYARTLPHVQPVHDR